MRLSLSLSLSLSSFFLSLSLSLSLSLNVCLECVRVCVGVFSKERTICVAFSLVMRCVDLIASYDLSNFLNRKSTVYQIRAIQCIMKKSFVHLQKGPGQ